MERLTFKKEFQNPGEEVNCACIDMHTYNRVVNEKEEHYYLAGEVIDKLADYEDKEEQGLLIELPCKIGDSLYQKRKDGMYEYKVIGLVYDIINKEWMLEVAVQVRSKWIKTVCSMECVGTTSFLTEAEAEEALARWEVSDEV